MATGPPAAILSFYINIGGGLVTIHSSTQTISSLHIEGITLGTGGSTLSTFLSRSVFA